MKNLILILAFFLLTQAAFSNTIGSIEHSFQVDREGQVFRGREPRKFVDDLQEFGITDVIIFKNDTKGEVVKELEDLESLGLNSHHIEFRWKDIPSMEVACEQVVEAINIIYRVKKNGGSTFFHCTAGEDRTGLLAGAYRMLEEGLSKEEVFEEEMCGRKYGDGNPGKPWAVKSAIQKELTPLFLSIAQKIEKGEWRLGKVTKKSCKGLQVGPTTLRCSR